MKHKKLLPLLMVATLLVGTLTVGAETTETQDMPANSTGITQVSGTLASTFTVKIPKTITVDISDGIINETYDVKVQGNITGIEQVKVVPDVNFAMKSNGKTDVDTTIAQEKTTFKFNEIVTENTQSGSLAATGLSAGTWTGTFNFNISLEEISTISENSVEAPIV